MQQYLQLTKYIATTFDTKIDQGKQAKIQKMSYCSIKSDIACLEDWLGLSHSSRKHTLQFKFPPGYFESDHFEFGYFEFVNII